MTAAITNLDSGLSVAYEYHVLDRVTSIHWRDADGATLRRFGYAFDVAGNITNLLMEGQALTSRRTHYGYDMLDRLTAETTPGSTNTWSYDLADNRTNATHNGAATAYTLGIGDRLASTSDGATYLYSAAGFVTNISVPSVPSVVSLSWNSQYQLIAAYTNGVLAESYQYDALSRRVSTTTGGITNYHVYDDNWQVLADLDANGNPLRSYTWAPGIDHLLAMTVYGTTATNTYYALTDHLGTVHALVDASGAIAESYEFDAWGNLLAVYDASGTPISNRQSAIGNRYLFQGREYSYATCLYHFRHRWHDPASGRWLSNDPIGIGGGLNQYAFCGNCPVLYHDAYGLTFSPDDDVKERFDKGMAELQLDMAYALQKEDPMKLTAEQRKTFNTLKRGLNELQSSKNYVIRVVSRKRPAYNPDSNTLYLEKDFSGVRDVKGTYYMPASILLAHELGHVLMDVETPLVHTIYDPYKGHIAKDNLPPRLERTAIAVENAFRLARRLRTGDGRLWLRPGYTQGR